MLSFHFLTYPRVQTKKLLSVSSPEFVLIERTSYFLLFFLFREATGLRMKLETTLLLHIAAVWCLLLKELWLKAVLMSFAIIGGLNNF